MDNLLTIDPNVGQVILGICGGFFAIALIASVVIKIIMRSKK